MVPHEVENYEMRSSSELESSRLKEDYGSNNGMGKVHVKVTMRLKLGVVVLFVDQLMRLPG